MVCAKCIKPALVDTGLTVDELYPFIYWGLLPTAAVVVVGERRTTASLRNLGELAARIREADGPATMRVYPGTGHIGIILSYAVLFRGRDPVYEDTLKFLEGL